MKIDYELWDKVVEFHGHECPGLAMGYRAALIALHRLDVSRAEDEELVAIVETDACGVDAIQVITGCTLGKGNLIFKDYGKQAFTVANRKTGRAVRVYVDPSKLEINKDDGSAGINQILSAEEENFCKIRDINVPIPEKARLFSSVFCTSCGERLAESRARLQDGKILCRECYRPYHRGW